MKLVAFNLARVYEKVLCAKMLRGKADCLYTLQYLLNIHFKLDLQVLDISNIQAFQH